MYASSRTSSSLRAWDPNQVNRLRTEATCMCRGLAVVDPEWARSF